MTIHDFEVHLTSVGLKFTYGGPSETFVIIKDVVIGGGTHAGEMCEVGILRSDANPWVPQAAVHVRPHLIAMGQRASQGSPIGPEWQYLSRRFDHVPTAKSFLAHILTVLNEL